MSESLGGGPLARLASEGRGGEWYPARPATPNEWRERCLGTRSAGGPWLAALRPALQLHPAARARLERVADGAGVFVTTGQQPGLFGGPLYTLAKALSALALADAIEECTGVPAAPLFWAATDDADFAEAAATVVVHADHAQLLRLPADRQDGTPLYDVPLGDVQPLLQELARACGSGADGSVLALVQRTYGAGSTIGGAYVALLAELLGPLGIPVLDAGHAAVRRAGHDTLLVALERAPQLDAALRRRESAIRAAGHAPQVEAVEGRSLVFDVRRGKQRIPITQRAEVAAAVAPGDLAPNVLLRPVLERSILPTVAYAAGPGELAYLAQSSAVAEALDLPAPLGVPRWSFSIVEPHVERVLRELDLAPADLQPLSTAEGRLARERIPDAVATRVRHLRDLIDAHIADLQHEAARHADIAFPPAPIEGARRSLQLRVDRLERRLLAAVKRADAERLRRVAAAAASLWPFGKRQERVANAVPFLTRYGQPLLERMLAEARAHARRLVTGQAIT